MKIALVFPRLRGQVHGMWPPIGIMLLGTILKNAGHHVSCHDTSFDADMGRVIKEIEKSRPDLVGVSCLTDFFRSAKEVVEAAKSQGMITVMGGPHPTIFEADLLKCLPALDYAILGEGDRSFPALVSALASGGDVFSIPGLLYRREGRVALTSPAEPVPDLDSLPIPERDLLDVNAEYLRAGAINLHASRGCPYRCRFCQPTLRKLFGAKVRFQSPRKVADEIEYYHRRYGLHDFFFHDDTFTVNKKWMAGLVEEFRARGLIDNFRYVVNSRVDIFDDGRARLLKEMGVYYVLFGIESGSQEVLDSLDKGITVEQIRAAYELCARYGFRSHAYVLLGAPAETPSSLRATEDLVSEIRPSTVHVSIFTPLPGTDLARECEEKGLTNIQDYSDMDYYLKKTSNGAPPVNIPGLTYHDLLASRERILKSRRLRVFIDNFKMLVKDIVHEPNLDKLIFRYQFYRRMRHYFG